MRCDWRWDGYCVEFRCPNPDLFLENAAKVKHKQYRDAWRDSEELKSKEVWKNADWKTNMEDEAKKPVSSSKEEETWVWKAEMVIKSEYTKMVRDKLQEMSNRHEELLDNVSKVERLTSGKKGSLVATTTNTVDRKKKLGTQT